MVYVYNDEDNNPMFDSETDLIMGYTTYYTSLAEMESAEACLPDIFGEEEK